MSDNEKLNPYEQRGPLNHRQSAGKRLISFSLWGDKPEYCLGALENAKRAKVVFPDWTCRFYVSKSVPRKIIKLIQEEGNTEVITVNYEDDWRGTLWKLFAVEDRSIDIVLFRDVNSRLSTRDALAVEDWMKTNIPLHIIRDHPFNNPHPIPPGSWGMVTEPFRWIASDVRKYMSNFGTGTLSQEDILEGRLEPENEEIEKNIDIKYVNKLYLSHGSHAFIHDSFPHFNPWSGRNFQIGRVKEFSTGFPVVRNAYGDHENKWNDFVGQKYNHKNKPNEKLAKELESVEKDLVKLNKSIMINQREWLDG